MGLVRKLEIVLQRDAMQCGAASLATVCRWYGCRIPLQEMERYCTPTRQGVSLKGIMDAAKTLGFETKAVKCGIADLAEVKSPCILHWRQDHFVVLYKSSKNGQWFYIADPACGKSRISRDEFERNWLSSESNSTKVGVALFLTPTEDFREYMSKWNKKDQYAPIILNFIKQYRTYFIHITLGLLLATGLQLIMPFLMQAVVDRGIGNRDISLIWLILLGEMAIILGRTATDFIRRWLLLHVGMRINISLKGSFFKKLMKLPMSFFEVKLTGDIMQRVNDHSRVQNFLTSQLLTIMFTSVSIIVFGGVLCFYNPVLFGVFSIFSALFVLWIRLFMNKRKVLDTELFRTESLNYNCTYELVSSLPEIKLQDCKQRQRWKWEDIQADLATVQMKNLGLQQTQEAGSVIINELKNLILTALAAVAVVNGIMSLGEMMAVQYIIGQLNSPVGQLMTFAYAWQDVKISLERITEIHEAKDETTGNTKIIPPQKFGFELRNVSFRYDPHDPRYAIKGLTLTIPEGKTTAIVGNSGSGKTTLLKLLLNYYVPESGKILLDGRNISDYDPDILRQRCGVVMQGGVIFSESIERNIACDDKDIDRTRLEHAVKSACLDKFISTLPLGYNTKIGAEGVGLSQGQKQRILIARAIYRNPDILLLDEATNSLDSITERAISEHINSLMAGCTVVIIAHRLSTVRNADNIIVLNEGRVAEQGTHDELVRKRSLYYTLVKNQLELGL